jgi:hypothetical protein
VVERSRVDDRALYTHCWRLMLAWLTENRAGPLGESGGSSIGNGEESDVES